MSMNSFRFEGLLTVDLVSSLMAPQGMRILSAIE